MVFAIPAAMIVGGMQPGRLRSAGAAALLLPAFVPDMVLAFLAMFVLPRQTLANPQYVRTVIILLSAARLASLCAFVGACAAGSFKDRGKNAMLGAFVGVVVGASVNIVRFLSSNMELHSILNPSMRQVETFDPAVFQAGLIFMQFDAASATWVFKTALQIVSALVVSVVVYLCVKFGIGGQPSHGGLGHDPLQDDNGDVVRIFPGVIFAVLFIVCAALPFMYTNAGAPAHLGLWRYAGNSLIMTIGATVLFAGFMFALVAGLAANLHKIGVVVLLLLLTAVFNNVLGDFLFHSSLGLLNTYQGMMVFQAFNITFALPLAFLVRTKYPAMTTFGGFARALAPYGFVFGGLFVSSAWGNSFAQLVHVSSQDRFGISMLVGRSTHSILYSAQMPLMWMIWWVAPVVLVAVGSV
ncbi:MAG: hypothetical protein FWG38_10695, partial [Defluviitaleaceae bacterium]|nr:hypothetical protein [Defluviitaleaceae bacterium]